jgi:hypothetical protein
MIKTIAEALRICLRQLLDTRKIDNIQVHQVRQHHQGLFSSTRWQLNFSQSRKFRQMFKAVCRQVSTTAYFVNMLKICISYQELRNAANLI